MTLNPRTIIIIACVVLILQAASLALYHRAVIQKHPVIAVIDLAGVYRAKEEQYAKLVSADKNDPKARQAAIEEVQRFSQQMPGHLQTISSECQCLVILANAVASKRPETADLTPLLRAKVGL